MCVPTCYVSPPEKKDQTQLVQRRCHHSDAKRTRASFGPEFDGFAEERKNQKNAIQYVYREPLRKR